MSTARMAVGFNGEPPSERWESHTARVVARRGRSGAVVTVSGELDAANAGDFAGYVHTLTEQCDWLVVDFSDLEFIGTAGFSSLRAIMARCLDQRVQWTLVPGSATSRLLRICDPDAALPTTASVDVALAKVQGSQRVQLVAPTR